MPEEFPLEPDLIDVLASETRREILRHLREQHQTVTELSRDLDLRKATIHEHLKKLVNAGLVEREEDDRVWVYYRLTPRGKRLLSPSRTRFYLAIGLSVLAALVGIVALAVYLSAGSPGMADQGASPEVEADAPTAAEGGLAPTYQLYSGDGVRIQTQGAIDPDRQAYLVDDRFEDEVQAGDADVTGIPLRVEARQAGAATEDSEDGDAEDASIRTQPTVLTTDAPVPPGTYRLFVRDDAGDNREQMPRVQVTDVSSTVSHHEWWTGVSEDLTVQATADSEPLDGHILLEAHGGGPPTHGAPLQDGQARFDAQRLDELPAASYTVVAVPSDADGRIELGTVTMLEPSIVVSPRVLPGGTVTELTVNLSQPGAPAEVPVRAAGDPLEDAAQGHTGEPLPVKPTEPGTLRIDIGRQASERVSVRPAYEGTLAVEEGPEHVLELSHASGEPAEDIAVRLNGEGLGFTDAQGRLHLDQLPEGTHTLSLQGPSGDPVQRGLHVSGWDIHPVRPSIDASWTGDPGPESIELELQETAGAQAQGTLRVTLDDQLEHTRAYDLAAYEERRIDLPMPASQHEGRHVVVEADAFQPALLAFENRTAGTDGSGGTVEGSETAEVIEEFTLGEPRAALGPVPGEADDTANVADEPIFGEPDAADAEEAGDVAETPSVGPLVLLVGLLVAVGLRPRG